MPLEFDGFLDDKKIYQESGNAIKLIVDHFGKDTLFDFLRNQSSIEDISELKEAFKKIFNAELNYSFFNTLRNEYSK